MFFPIQINLEYPMASQQSITS
jgi:hypothetical protein